MTRNHSPDRPDSETIFAMKKYEFPGGHDMFYTDELTETPTVTDKSHLTEKIPSPIASRPNTAGTERSDASGRTQFSVESVSFSKQSKVVKTITIHDGNEINDLQKSPVFAKESKKDLVEPDNVSGKFEFSANAISIV